ncbi:biotin--[acetyl-CoA-carboxylase] ligase [Propionibacteriaceae bacterium Y1923]|uniref:biotin--[acetyl-CoA-carboxylase] ligase n=1 Tax=Aestuariimicrobium sp. Y1814 TaxID=3418742 RepID=UPI003C250FB1
MPATPPADAAAITSLLATSRGLWREVRTIAETGSTNADVAALAGAGAAEGLVLVAEHQTSGRGRLDRTWTAPPGSSVAISALLRPTRPLQDWTWLPLLTGLAVSRAVRASAPSRELADRVQVKWPNDVLVTDAPGVGKLCGILLERHEAAGGQQHAAAVIGLGLNIDLAPDELPVPTATSLAGAGLDSDKDRVIAALLDELAELYELWQRRGHLVEAYQRECGTIGQQVRVELSPSTSVHGSATGVDEQGRLLVRTPDGLKAFAAGDVHHLRPPRT